LIILINSRKKIINVAIMTVISKFLLLSETLREKMPYKIRKITKAGTKIKFPGLESTDKIHKRNIVHSKIIFFEILRNFPFCQRFMHR
ncbi:MAG: hypothetical protein QXS38_02175, partial [Candidatus Pacearchaeota archaeon]